MNKFKISIDRTFEASSEEDALNQLQGEIGKVTRIMGGGAEVDSKEIEALRKGLTIKEIK